MLIMELLVIRPELETNKKAISNPLTRYRRVHHAAEKVTRMKSRSTPGGGWYTLHLLRNLLADPAMDCPLVSLRGNPLFGRACGLTISCQHLTVMPVTYR